MITHFLPESNPVNFYLNYFLNFQICVCLCVCVCADIVYDREFTCLVKITTVDSYMP